MSQLTHVVVLDDLFAAARETVQQQFAGLRVSVAGSADDRNTLLADADVLVTQKEPVGEELLARASRARLLLKLGRVYDNIDVEAARARNLPMAAAPRKGPRCVAELALTLMLALSKELLRSHGHVAGGEYQRLGLEPKQTAERSYAFKWMKQDIQELYGRTLGLVGMGEIGAELARRARVMGMRVLYHKRSRLSAELEARFDVAYHDLHPLLQASQYVCLVVPHTAETERMIGPQELEAIGPRGYLVNVARGAVVDEEALITALQNRVIAGAGLDVFRYEPLPGDSPLCQLDNVILTPHIGGGSGSNPTLELGEALTEVESILAGNSPQEPI